IHQIEIDRYMQKVTVMGFADQRKVLKAMKKTGKVVEPWPYQLNNDMEYTYNQYYHGNRINGDDYSTSSHLFASIPHNYSGSNYNHHGRNRYSRRGHISYFDQPAYSDLVKDKPGAYFSDDNAVGCSIM
ncbi:hypothetical protein CRG98_049934, partial [Punica granatum]